MARKQKNVHLDRAQAKAAKQKKLAIVLSGVLALVLVYEVPNTLKVMNAKPKAPIVNTSAAAPPVETPTGPVPAASPSSTPSTPPPVETPSAPTQSLVSSIQVSPDPGQLTQFTLFASKDPFTDSVEKTTTTPAATAKKPAAKPKTPPPPPPTSAVIAVNGELMSVTVGGQFPTAGTVFDEVGSPLFLLDSLTQKTAKVSIAGGSYADGAPTLTLDVGKPVTLQNTADGTRYTLLLEPQGTAVPAQSTDGASSSPTTTTPTDTTTTGSVVPTSPSG
jgi:hypothetical protein